MHFRWIDIARREIGVGEFPGADSNPRIGEYFAACGWPETTTDATPWCSAFVCWVMRQADEEHTESVRARSWERYGHYGQFARGSIAGWIHDNGRGHVGFVEGFNGDRVWLLGGNQRNVVNVTAYRFDEAGGRRWFSRLPDAYHGVQLTTAPPYDRSALDGGTTR